MKTRISLVLVLIFLAGLAIAQNVLNYGEQGGARTVIGGSLDVISGGDLDIESGGSLKIAGTAVTSTAAELNILVGVTATAAEINAVDGNTSTAAQLSAIDGGAVFESLIFCGDGPSGAGTVYMAPAVAFWGGGGGDTRIAQTVCDAGENSDEGTADAPLLTNVAYKIAGVICVTDGTIGSAETVVFNMRSALADTTPAITCTIAEAEKDCSITTATTTDISAGATVAMKAVQTGDNTTDNYWCRATIIYQ